MDFDDHEDEISFDMQDVSLRNSDADARRVVLWASRQTGLSASKLRALGYRKWTVVACLAEIGRSDIDIPGLEPDWQQSQLRDLGLSEDGAAKVREKLSGLSDLHKYIEALPQYKRPCFTSLCDQGILTLEAYKLHYEQSIVE